MPMTASAAAITHTTQAAVMPMALTSLSWLEPPDEDDELAESSVDVVVVVVVVFVGIAVVVVIVVVGELGKSHR